jgi:hypothetical protein
MAMDASAQAATPMATEGFGNNPLFQTIADDELFPVYFDGRFAIDLNEDNFLRGGKRRFLQRIDRNATPLWLKDFWLTAILHMGVQQTSGGQQQRTCENQWNA